MINKIFLFLFLSLHCFPVILLNFILSSVFLTSVILSFFHFAICHPVVLHLVFCHLVILPYCHLSSSPFAILLSVLLYSWHPAFCHSVLLSLCNLPFYTFDTLLSVGLSPFYPVICPYVTPCHPLSYCHSRVYHSVTVSSLAVHMSCFSCHAATVKSIIRSQCNPAIC